MAFDTLKAHLVSFVLALAMFADSTASGTSPLASDVAIEAASPLFVQGSGTIYPVEAADGRVHLVYELLLANQGMVTVSIASIEALDAAGEVLQTVSADELRTKSRQSLLGGDATVLHPSQSALVFMDVSLAPGAPLPLVIKHGFVAILSTSGGGGTASFGGLTVETIDVAGTIFPSKPEI